MLFQQIAPEIEERVIYERESGNTYENARNSVDIIKKHGIDQEGEWLLVTSAFHLPRAMQSFHKQGINPIPWPVDYQSVPAGRWNPTLHDNLEDLYLGVHEWLGLIGYRLLGRI